MQPRALRFLRTLLILNSTSVCFTCTEAFVLFSSPRCSSRQQALLRHEPQLQLVSNMLHERKTVVVVRSSVNRTRKSPLQANKENPSPSPSKPQGIPSSSVKPMTRVHALGFSLSAWIAGLTVATEWSQALGPVKKSQELLRIWGQEDFDNSVLGGGELASPDGGKTIQPVLALIPIVTLRLQLDEVENFLRDPRTFGDALDILKTQDFQKKDIKRAFNLYSDNIYYLPGSERENKYLQGGATPSTRQTLQYLLRNDVIDNVEALTAEIAYLIRERDGSSNGAGGGASDNSSGGAADLDETDLRLYLAKCKASFDKYLGMVYQSEVDEATNYAKMALAAREKTRRRT